MADTFETAVTTVLAYEGGYVNDPQDPGGETNFGISKRAYPTLDIKNLTVDDAKAIYRRDYWQRCSCDLLPPMLAMSVFDCAVNQGPAVAIKTLQQALGVVADGIIGPATMDAARSSDRRAVLRTFLAYRAVRYAGLSTFPRFGVGWMQRLFAVQEASLGIQ